METPEHDKGDHRRETCSTFLSRVHFSPDTRGVCVKEGKQYVNRSQLCMVVLFCDCYFILPSFCHSTYIKYLLYAKHASLCLALFPDFSTVRQLHVLLL